jgi:hypothetical protein
MYIFVFGKIYRAFIAAVSNMNVCVPLRGNMTVGRLPFDARPMCFPLMRNAKVSAMLHLNIDARF